MRLIRGLGVCAVAAMLTLAGCSNSAPQQSGTDAGGGGGAAAGGGADKGGGDNAGGDKGGTAKADLTVAVVTHGQAGDAFWDIVKSGADQAGKDENVKVTYNGDGDPGRQSQLIDNAVASKVDGLVVSMANPDGVKDSVRQAVKAGIPVVTMNSGLEKYKEFGAVTHVGQSEELAGEAAGRKLSEAGVKKVLCVVHEAGNVGLESRCNGVRKTLGGTVRNLQVDVSNVADAQNTIKAQLLADKSVDGVLTLNPVIAKAAVSARQEAGSKAKLATFDVSADICAAIARGDMLFAVDQQPYLQGYLPVVFVALKIRNGNDVGGGQPVYSGPGFVTKDNAEQVRKFAERGTR
ncbi:simple sugar transport system substrate-binding protein [Actinopolymorpha cephalotaxi]|uniref:Simple sugar transport system substrate-binding protein n=1 Tax=Actinopolymorpha cephalotaxi TaxID=504797 RepID=A0A1I2WFH7_9ACTN|nr:sugar ABC transporter substrate-binding protein [Actinopolymorpha cephalotaxi]NYH82626.1 simple sugar transport system substrate-binding protein [Actinopolymorpha cephalotaxi]SFG99499.1 simple sugar transport system substrate-binding protein [Actinopolymorpha cephalotaxi]